MTMVKEFEPSRAQLKLCSPLHDHSCLLPIDIILTIWYGLALIQILIDISSYLKTLAEALLLLTIFIAILVFYIYVFVANAAKSLGNFAKRLVTTSIGHTVTLASGIARRAKVFASGFLISTKLIT